MDVSWLFLSTPAAEHFSQVVQTTPAQVKNDMGRIFKELSRKAGPGCVFSAEKENAFVIQGATGFADIEKKKPLTADSVFNLASVSKQFTALPFTSWPLRKNCRWMTLFASTFLNWAATPIR